MKTRKRIFPQLTIALVAISLFTACEPEEESVAKPTINLTEVGLENSKTAILGGDLHLEAEIVALGRISTVTVELHAETRGGSELDTTYTEFNGLKNTSFHKHIEIPSSFEAGDYHLHLTVTDQLGQQTTAESEVTLQAPSTPLPLPFN